MPLHELDDGLRKGELLCTISHHLRRQFVLNHKLRQVPDDLGRRSYLEA